MLWLNPADRVIEITPYGIVDRETSFDDYLNDDRITAVKLLWWEPDRWSFPFFLKGFQSLILFLRSSRSFARFVFDYFTGFFL